MNYFIIENNSQQGPFTLEELRLYHLTSETLVWAEGMAEWTPAWKVEELRPIINGTPPEIPASTRMDAPPGSDSNAPENDWQSSGTPPYRENRAETAEKQSRNGNSRLIGIIALLIILLLMAFTNPSKEAHETAIHSEVATAMDKMTGDEGDDIFSQGFNMLSRMIGHRILDAAIGQILTYHNYGLFSTCTIEFDGRSHTASFGCFGHVWTMNSKDIERKINGSVIHNNDPGTEDDKDAFGRQHNGQEETPDAEQQVQQNSPADDTETDIQKYVIQQADKSIQQVSEKVKTSIRNEVNQHTDSTSAKTVNKLIDKLLNLFGL